MRLIFITGMPSGGTTATAGTLHANGVFMRYLGHSYEEMAARNLFPCDLFQTPRRRLVDKDLDQIRWWRDDLIRSAEVAGWSMCGAKVPWAPIWLPALFEIEGIEGLLVRREVASNAASIAARFPNVAHRARALAEIGQQQIDTLEQQLGLPAWTFGRDADLAELEAAVGFELPVGHFRPERVCNQQPSGDQDHGDV